MPIKQTIEKGVRAIMQRLGIQQTMASVPPLTLPEFQNRMSGHVYTLYLNYSFLIKGGVYTVAAQSLLHLPQADHSKVEHVSVRFLFWFVSFLFSLITISTWSRGSAMTNAKAGSLDVILPIGIAIPEYLLFIILDPTTSGTGRWYWWYLFAALHAAFGLSIVLYRKSLTKLESDYDEDMRPLAILYVNWMRADQFGASVGVGLNLAFFLITYFWSWLASSGAEWVHWVVGLVLVVIGFKITSDVYA